MIHRALAEPVCAALVIGLSPSGQLEYLDVTPPPEHPVLHFSVDRALSWVLDHLRLAEDTMETAADVLAKVPVSPSSVIERLILQEISAVQINEAGRVLAGRF